MSGLGPRVGQSHVVQCLHETYPWLRPGFRALVYNGGCAMRMLLSLLLGAVIGGPAQPAGAYPAQAAELGGIKVRYQKSPGLPDFNASDVILDSKDLTAEQRKQFRKIIEEIRFFEQKSTLTEVPPYVP